jgi:PRTRC genetic system protein F
LLTRDSGLPSFLFAPPTALALPGFSPDVPISSARPRQGVEIYLQAMAELDILKPQHWYPNDASRSMKAAISTLFPGVEMDRMSFHVTDDMERGNGHQTWDYDPSTIREKHKFSALTVVGGFYLTCNDFPRWMNIGPKLSKLEKQCKGFGQTIIDVIARSSWCLTGAVTPAAVAYQASGHYWMGENDESLVVDEQFGDAKDYLTRDGASAEEKAKGLALTKDNLEDIFRKKDLYRGGVPEWAFTPKSWGGSRISSMKSVHLKQATLYEMERAQQILALLKKLLTYNDTNEREWVDYPSEFTVQWVLRWNDEDNFFRIIDDCYQVECQSGDNHDISWAAFFRSGDPGDVRRALRRVIKMAEGIKVLEKLIDIIGTETRKLVRYEL